MRRQTRHTPRPAGAGAVAALLILVMLGGPGAAPDLSAQDRGAGPALPPYDSARVETLTGLVVAVPPPPAAGVPAFAHFTLKVGAETLTVLLGPSWYLARQGFALKPLDRVTVQGSRTTVAGKPALVAAAVTKDGATLRLRDDHGAPLWGGEKRP